MIVLGPVRCHECHLPGLFYDPMSGWLEGVWKNSAAPVRSYRKHHCTAREPLRIEMPRRVIR